MKNQTWHLPSSVWSFGNIYPVPKISQTAMSFLHVHLHALNIEEMSQPGMVQ